MWRGGELENDSTRYPFSGAESAVLGVHWYHRLSFWSCLLKDISHCLLVRYGRVIIGFQNKARSILRKHLLDTWVYGVSEECFHAGETVHPGLEIPGVASISEAWSIRERMTFFY